MAFRVGQPVVCIDNSMRGNSQRHNATYPEVGPVYHIRAIFPHPADGRSLLLLREIVNDITFADGQECGFCASRFRPVQERKQSTETGMTILRGLLKTQKVDA